MVQRACRCGKAISAYCQTCGFALCSEHESWLARMSDSFERYALVSIRENAGPPYTQCESCLRSNKGFQTAMAMYRSWPKNPFDRYVAVSFSHYNNWQGMYDICYDETIGELLSWWKKAASKAGIRMVTVQKSRLVRPSKQRFVRGTRPAEYAYDQVSAWKLTTYISHTRAYRHDGKFVDKERLTYEDAYLLPDGEVLRADGRQYHPAPHPQALAAHTSLFNLLTTTIGEARGLRK